jgi:hypothetical protein
VLQREADVVEAVDEAMLAEGSMSKRSIAPSGVATVCARDRRRAEAGKAFDRVEQPVDLRLGSTIGSRPFLKQLLKKMSAYDGAISARKP